MKNIDIDIYIDIVILEMEMDFLENIDIDMDFLENIDIDMDFFENINIDKGILQNIAIDTILYRLEFGISNRASYLMWKYVVKQVEVLEHLEVDLRCIDDTVVVF